MDLNLEHEFKMLLVKDSKQIDEILEIKMYRGVNKIKHFVCDRDFYMYQLIRIKHLQSLSKV